MKQIEWVRGIFEQNEKLDHERRIIFSMHEFNGMNYFIGKFQRFWENEYHEAFLDILKKYHKNVALISSSHIHRMEMRNQISIDHPMINIS